MTALFGLSQKGKSPTVTAQRHLNLYAEINQDEKPLVFYGTPGLRFCFQFGETPVRGWIVVGDFFYAVHMDKFYEVDNSNTYTERGTLNTSSGFVDMSYDGQRILITTGTSGYIYTIATHAFSIINSPGFVNSANTCTWMDGFFVADFGDGSDSFSISADGITWDALDFASAESNPDGIVRVFFDNGEIVILGESTTEFWGNVGATDFPLSPIKGAAQEFGLAARRTLTKFNSGIAALMKTKQGQIQVMFFQGYVPKKLSTQEIDSIINGYGPSSNATAFAYMLGGHPMLQINFPSANASWLFDASTNLWSPLEYGTNGNRHRAEMYIDYLGKPLVSDYENGNIYEISTDVYTDNGMTIVREIIGRNVYKNGDQFNVNELFVEFETGIGLVSGQGSNPQIMLTISKDNGRTWGNELWTGIGKIGDYMARAIWRRLEKARNWCRMLHWSVAKKSKI